MALGFAEGAKAMERRLTGAHAGSFLIASDIAGNPGFSAKREGSIAVFDGGKFIARSRENVTERKRDRRFVVDRQNPKSRIAHDGV